MDELPPGGFKLSTSRQGPTLLVRLFGELDLANRESMREALRAAERGDAESVLLEVLTHHRGAYRFSSHGPRDLPLHAFAPASG